MDKYIKTFESFIDSEGNLQELTNISFDDIPVLEIDVEKLNESIDDEIRDKIVNPDSKLRIRTQKLGIIELPNSNTDKIAVVDDELVGKFMVDSKMKLSVYEDTYENGNLKGLAIMPKYEIDINLEELKRFVKGETTIKEFMGDRYNYNDRIERNMVNVATKLGLKF